MRFYIFKIHRAKIRAWIGYYIPFLGVCEQNLDREVKMNLFPKTTQIADLSKELLGTNSTKDARSKMPTTTQKRYIK